MGCDKSSRASLCSTTRNLVPAPSRKHKLQATSKASSAKLLKVQAASVKPQAASIKLQAASGKL
jgi:hypothetical protein